METVSSVLMEAVFAGPVALISKWKQLPQKNIYISKTNKKLFCFLAPLHCSCILAPGFNVFFILCPLFALHTHPQHQNNAPTPPPDASRERKFSAFLCRRIFTRGRYKGEATGGEYEMRWNAKKQENRWYQKANKAADGTCCRLSTTVHTGTNHHLTPASQSDQTSSFQIRNISSSYTENHMQAHQNIKLGS